MINFISDESGSFTIDAKDYFVLVLLSTKDIKDLKILLRKTKKAKLSKRERRKSTEIKASLATDKFKKYFYTRLQALTSVKIYILFLQMRDIPLHMRKKEGLIYLRMMQALLKLAKVEKFHIINLTLDKRTLKGISREAFDLALQEEFGGSFKKQRFFCVHHVDSTESYMVQIADFVAHAAYQKYQRHNLKWHAYIKNLIETEINARDFL